MWTQSISQASSHTYDGLTKEHLLEDPLQCHTCYCWKCEKKGGVTQFHLPLDLILPKLYIQGVVPIFYTDGDTNFLVLPCGLLNKIMQP